jgi:hypothetical protein
MSISFNFLGQQGRLGNQIFQFAATKGLASHHKYHYIIPKENHQLIECFTLQSLDESNFGFNQVSQRINERFFNWDKLLFDQCPDNIDLFGYFQSEKYFKHIANELRFDLTFKKDILKTAFVFLENLSKEPIISLHIRRGDYVNHPRHGGCCTNEYYSNALDLFDKHIPVVIVSDDPSWIKTQDLFKSDRFIVSNNNQFVDLCIMSLCDYHIIANSSFSWWGSWLSCSEKTIAPKQWFTSAAGIENWNDIYCCNRNWILI